MAQQPVENLEIYVDVEDALARVCGNKAIYKKLLIKFADSLQIEELMAKVTAGELDAAAKLAHTMKGVTANLSFPAAYRKCIEVEAGLKQGEANTAELEKLREILETTVLCAEYIAETI